MKKKIFTLSVFITIVFNFISCSFFTNSWGKGVCRNMDTRFSNFKTEELADMSKDSALINDFNSSKALLVELGKKDDLTSLSAQQKNDILNLMSNASIPTDVVVSISDTVANVNSEDAAKEFVTSIFEQINSIDVEAATMILSDEEGLSSMDDKIICMSSICLAAQVAKSSDLLSKTDEFQEQIKNVASASEGDREAAINSAVDAIFSGVEDAEESKEKLQIAFNAIYSVKESDVNLIPGMSLKDMFSKLGEV